jgi:hypothetical protein
MEHLQRRCSALEQFFLGIQGQASLNILDLSPVSQANVTFLSGLGHRLYCQDLLASLDEFFGGSSDFFQAQENASRAQDFLEQSFAGLDGQFQGVLVWDTLQYLSPTLLDLTVRTLHRVMTPDAMMLAFFHADEKARIVPTHYYRIHDQRTLNLVDRGSRPIAQFFNNRVIEKSFADFTSVKFFISRDHLREVLVRR